MVGFTYNGKHTSEMNVIYIPGDTERGDFFADYTVESLDRVWFPGAEYFYTRTKARTFSLSCYYNMITYAEREQILKWIDRRTSGELIFDERPYAVYTVRPSKMPDFKDYLQRENDMDYYSGTFTLTLTAYYPYARLTQTTSDLADDHALDELDLLPSGMMPTYVASDTEILVYNPGTEIGHSTISFKGNTGSDNFTITNITNGDVYTLRAGLNTGNDTYIADSRYGRIYKDTGSTRILDLSFHDGSYIRFEPNRILRDQIAITTTSGSKTITSNGMFSPDYVGAYAWLDSGWRYIASVESADSAKINVNAASTGRSTSKIVTMNYLTISKAANVTVTAMTIECEPEVR